MGIGSGGLRTITGDELERMTEAGLDELLAGDEELIFARSSPEAKLRITVAPALCRVDVGVAMGTPGTDTARKAATMVLTDDDFASNGRAYSNSVTCQNRSSQQSAAAGGHSLRSGFSAVIVGVGPLQLVFGTAVTALSQLLMLLPFPFLVWGSDEVFKWFLR